MFWMLPALMGASGAAKGQQEKNAHDLSVKQRTAETRASTWNDRAPTTQIKPEGGGMFNNVLGGVMSGVNTMVEGAKSAMGGGAPPKLPDIAGPTGGGDGTSATTSAPGMNPGAQEVSGDPAAMWKKQMPNIPGLSGGIKLPV